MMLGPSLHDEEERYLLDCVEMDTVKMSLDGDAAVVIHSSKVWQQLEAGGNYLQEGDVQECDLLAWSRFDFGKDVGEVIAGDLKVAEEVGKQVMEIKAKAEAQRCLTKTKKDQIKSRKSKKRKPTTKNNDQQALETLVNSGER